MRLEDGRQQVPQLPTQKDDEADDREDPEAANDDAMLPDSEWVICVHLFRPLTTRVTERRCSFGRPTGITEPRRSLKPFNLLCQKREEDPESGA